MKRGVFAIVHCAQLLCASSRQVQCATRSEDATKMARCGGCHPAGVRLGPGSRSSGRGLDPGRSPRSRRAGAARRAGQLSDPGGQNTSVSSSIWAGYAVTGAAGSFTSVSASWTQPTASCAAGSQYTAFWVGLDGYASKTVEQIGTEADCTGANPRVSA